jgi:xanthine/uracil permease
MENTTRTTRLDDGECIREETSITGLFRQLRDETTQLLRQEVALVKTEMSEKGARVGRNTAYLAVGGLVAYAGVLLLLAAISVLIAWLLTLADVNPWIAGWVGPLIVGVIVAVIGYSLVQKALATLKNETPVPEKTIETLKEDKQWVQNRMA